MSTNSFKISRDEIAALLAELGGIPGEIERNSEIDAVTEKLSELRAGIRAAMAADKVGVRELARRRNVSAATISRALNSEKDMYLGTAVLLAAALGRKLPPLHLLLVADDLKHAATNYQIVETRSSPQPSISTKFIEPGSASKKSFDKVLSQNV